MQKMQKFCFYRGIMWLLNSYKVTIMDVVKNCQEKIEYTGKDRGQKDRGHPLKGKSREKTPFH